MLTAAQIRQQFLDFFASKQHDVVPSAPIVVKNDPTLLFTNAGMNQFKDYFLGNKVPVNPRIADTQKCLRVSGKHNDLEEVGVDTYHHTMFEMLGNWSFGNYFKAEAIAWSWELLTKVYQLDKDRLYVTIFEGDTKEGLPRDEEAYNEWKKWIAEDRILLGNKKDNFWEMGDTGPCGPCTEIHVDCRTPEERAAVPGKDLVNNDHPQVIEIWNNVFIQFNRLKDGSLQQLPAKHVDTGMGFERLVRVLQGKTSNYDTDVFTGTIKAIEGITNKTYKAGDDKQSVAFRVLADHIRAISFTIADGQLPSNTGAGYVIRRILRRAVRYYYSYLDYKQPLLFQLVPVLAAQFENVFPELHQQLDFVIKVVKEEEDAFLRTLEKGLKRINDILTTEKARGSGSINGKEAFELFDTYGFPIDLTRLIAQENNLQVDEPAFEAEMAQQKARSRAATAIDTEDWVIVNDVASTSFVGYHTTETTTKVVKYRKVKAKGTEAYQIVLEATPFYAESGGQVGDSGTLTIGDATITIYDTKKENNLFIHFADAIPAVLSGSVIAQVNTTRRHEITVHHSATHLMHAALRKVLGTHVAQKGSLVNEEHLRFDFSHFAKLTAEEIAQVEAIVNTKIRENVPVVIKEMSKDDAIAMGAMALFGEKYADTVRVVVIDPNYSIELCGGTHVGSTGELGFFAIKHETAVAAGVRRVEAVCGAAAEQYIVEHMQLLQDIKVALKHPKDVLKAIEQQQAEVSDLRKKLESLEAKQLAAIQASLVPQATTYNEYQFLGAQVEVSSADALRNLAVGIKTALGDVAVVVLTAAIDGKASVVIAAGDTAVTKGVDAGKLIKTVVAPLIKGGGGGQKHLANAGGVATAQLPQVVDAVKNAL
ncbi:MAG: alanine--tRNA ligase [Chitinophagaceae bacterium]